MDLSVSVRIVEAPCKTKLNVPLEDFIGIVQQGGAGAICMRASGAGVTDSPARLQELALEIAAANLPVTMVTADYDVPLNNEDGPASLRNIRPSLDVAAAFNAAMFAPRPTGEPASLAQRLQQAALDLINDPTRPPRYAHPAYWGAFAIIGDGTRTQ